MAASRSSPWSHADAKSTKLFAACVALARTDCASSGSWVGLHTAVKPLLGHSATGELNSPPEIIRRWFRVAPDRKTRPFV
eukprot:3517396-Pyramimonas_sp.AAC.1